MDLQSEVDLERMTSRELKGSYATLSNEARWNGVSLLMSLRTCIKEREREREREINRKVGKLER